MDYVTMDVEISGIAAGHFHAANHVVAPAVGILRGATCERNLVVPFLLLYGASSQEPQSQRGWFTDWLHLLLYLEIPSLCSNMFQLFCRSILLHSVPWKKSGTEMALLPCVALENQQSCQK
jgi:hypothetical protein